MEQSSTPWIFVASIAVLAFSAAGVILLVPGLIRSGGEQHLGLVVALAIVAGAAAVGTQRYRG